MPEAFRLPRAIAAELLQLAQASPDEEICGLIAGGSAGVTRCFAITNVAADRTRFFELDPKGQIDALRAMRERDEELQAIYHSHPRGPAAPSRRDVERHEYPDALCLIIAVDPPELKAFRMRGGHAHEVAVDLGSKHAGGRRRED